MEANYENPALGPQSPRGLHDITDDHDGDSPPIYAAGLEAGPLESGGWEVARRGERGGEGEVHELAAWRSVRSGKGGGGAGREGGGLG